MRKQKGFAELVGVVLLFVLVFGGLFGFAYFTNSAKCKNRATMMGLEYNYAMLQGCMVKVGDRWAPMSYIRITDDKVIIQGDGE